MADTAISGLPDGATVQTTDELAVNRGGSNFRVVTGILAALNSIATGRIDNNAVTVAKMQAIATQTFLGRVTAATGDPEIITSTQAKAILSYLASEVAVTPTGGVSATDVQAAVAELDSDKAPTVHTHPLSQITDSGALAALNTVNTAQIDTDAVGPNQLAQTAVAAGAFTNTDLTVDAQGRITAAANGAAPLVDSVFGRTNAVVAVANDYTAALVQNAPLGGISATNVQDAVNQLDSDKAPTVHTHPLSQITDSGALAALDTVDTAQIDDNAVTFPKIQDITPQRVLGRTSVGSGDVEEVDLSALTDQASPASDDILLAERASDGVLVGVQVGNLPGGVGAGVDSFNTRTGPVVSVSGDYTIAQITGAAALASLDTVGTTEIDNDAVTFAKIQNVATQTILGRTTAATGDPEELTATQARAVLNVEDGATADQTPTQIKVSYESNADTNAFTDAELSKLNGIENGATNNSGALADLNTVDTPEIDDDAVTFAKMQNIATASFIGRDTAATGDPEELSAAEAKAVLAYLASEVAFTPAGFIAATDVQAALAEVDADKPQISTEDELAGQMQIAVVATLPGTPDANTLYFVTT